MVYLLEHSRVTAQHDSGYDRNFHIFYWILDGLKSQNRLKEFHLEANKCYRIIGPIYDTEVYTENFDKVIVGFKLIGFRDADINEIFKIIAAVILLGELEFIDVINDDSTNGSKITDTTLINNIASLLSIDVNNFILSLCTSTVASSGEMVCK